MSREKIRVPGKVYEELVALQREIHFTQDHNDTVKKAEDRGYMAAANWIRQNERAYKIGFAWGFESDGEEPQGTIRDIPQREAPPVLRHDFPQPDNHPATVLQKIIREFRGVIAGIKNWIGKYF